MQDAARASLVKAMMAHLTTAEFRLNFIGKFKFATICCDNAPRRSPPTMADLATYEQELLRRNAALEERAAASIARAKAVVDGQSQSQMGVSALVAKSAAFASDEQAGLTPHPSQSPSKTGRNPNDTLLETLADALYTDEVENYDPHREALDAQLRVEGALRRSLDKGKQKKQPASKTSVRRSQDPNPFGNRDLADIGTVDASEDPVEFSDDAYGRLAKARIQALRDQLSAQGKELRDVHGRLKERDGELKNLLTDKQAVQKTLKQAQNALEKERRSTGELKDLYEAKSRELIEAKKEADKNGRLTNKQQLETKSRDVRLNRALEEVDRYKKLLTDAKDTSKGGSAESRREATELRQELKVLTRQKAELINAFKKQSKLVDVLRKQKIHLEQARVVQFAEEEFLGVLEKGESAGGR